MAAGGVSWVCVVSKSDSSVLPELRAAFIKKFLEDGRVNGFATTPVGFRPKGVPNNILLACFYGHL